MVRRRIRYFLGLDSASHSETQMTTRLTTTLLAIGLAAVAVPASAQWPSYPTPNVPRNADGTVEPHRTCTAHRRRQAGS